MTKRDKALTEMFQYHLDGIGQDFDDLDYTLKQVEKYLKREYKSNFESVLNEHILEL